LAGDPNQSSYPLKTFQKIQYTQCFGVVNPLTLLAESGQPLAKGATPLSSSMLRACQKGGHTHGPYVNGKDH